ncbi:MAG: PP2C family serine/threonine-protein phosphatase [Rikenellaceae bacterium]
MNNEDMKIELTPEVGVEFEEYKNKFLWDNYCKETMDNIKVIENSVLSLNIQFPNGTAAKDYQFELKIDTEIIEDYWFEGLDAVGLSEQRRDDCSIISGSPLAAGDYKVEMWYKYKGWIDGKPTLSRTFTITINPDPKSLWRDLPTPTDIEYFKEDYATDYVEVNDDKGLSQKDIVAASKRGRSHAHDGKARDDDFSLKYCEDSGWYIIAVADGAGSALFSREGSRIACASSVRHCTERLAAVSDFDNNIIELNNHGSESEYRKRVADNIYEIVGNAAFKAHRAVLEEAQSKERAVKTYSTTLLLSICKRFEFGWFVASFWVGDGAMAIYDKDNSYIKLLGKPDGGEYAGQTRFLTMPDIFKDVESIYSRLRYSIEKDFTALFVMSDGVSDPMFETDANLERVAKWDELWVNINSEVELIDNNRESQYQLAKWLDFWSAGNHDDRTIAILY